MSSAMTKLFLLELNEINFDFVKRYIASGKLPNLARLIDEHGIIETTSEQEYDKLEPWIQWVTAHTGKSFAEHGVFRLGDIVNHEIEQIWEVLERHNVSVAALSPMNAKNRTTNAAFFMPDPWTSTPVTGPTLLAKISAAISQAVNNNAQARISPTSMYWLFLGALRYARLKSYTYYLILVWRALNNKEWAKAQILEELLANIAIKECRSKKPQFVSLFMNAGAHIQHHYMFNASVYDGTQRNPKWLVAPQHDPVFEIYNQYDRILGHLRQALPDYRLIISTGLHQDPYPELKYYWRLKDHQNFLNMIGAKFLTVEPRMSRDFLIQCDSKVEAIATQMILESSCDIDGIKLFDIDNRGDSLFVMLTYPKEISQGLQFKVGNIAYPLKEHCTFVAIKNGEHNGIGYLIDTAEKPQETKAIPLTTLPSRIAEAFGLNWAKILKT
jgi:hypothetical protein